MDNENIAKDVETIQIGDTMYNKDDVTPSVYFNYVKGLKTKLNAEEYNVIIDTTIKLLQKAMITKQTDMAKKLTSELELAIREFDTAKKGFDIYVSRKDIEKYIGEVEAKSIKIVELSKYEREIPDEVIDKISKAQEIFDELYIVFTDYTKKETKKVARHRRDKDPIVFGAFKNDKDPSNVYVEDRLFFIADWVEDKCDLTLEELCRDIHDIDDRTITYKVTTPKGEDEAKKILDSFTVETMDESELETESIFEFVKKKISRRKKTTDDKKTTSKKPLRRGRKKKED